MRFILYVHTYYHFVFVIYPKQVFKTPKMWTPVYMHEQKGKRQECTHTHLHVYWDPCHRQCPQAMMPQRRKYHKHTQDPDLGCKTHICPDNPRHLEKAGDSRSGMNKERIPQTKDVLCQKARSTKKLGIVDNGYENTSTHVKGLLLARPETNWHKNK